MSDWDHVWTEQALILIAFLLFDCCKTGWIQTSKGWSRWAIQMLCFMPGLLHLPSPWPSPFIGWESLWHIHTKTGSLSMKHMSCGITTWIDRSENQWTSCNPGLFGCGLHTERAALQSNWGRNTAYAATILHARQLIFHHEQLQMEQAKTFWLCGLKLISQWDLGMESIVEITHKILGWGLKPWFPQHNYEQISKEHYRYIDSQHPDWRYW